MSESKKAPNPSAPLAYSLADLARAAGGVSRGYLYQEMAAGRLETRKAGRRRIVTADAARRWLEALPKA